MVVAGDHCLLWTMPPSPLLLTPTSPGLSADRYSVRVPPSARCHLQGEPVEETPVRMPLTEKLWGAPHPLNSIPLLAPACPPRPSPFHDPGTIRRQFLCPPHPGVPYRSSSPRALWVHFLPSPACQGAQDTPRLSSETFSPGSSFSSTVVLQVSAECPAISWLVRRTGPRPFTRW